MKLFAIYVGGELQGANIELHDMRFVFLENDTKLLFATAYDGEWDAYIDDFVTKIPTSMDIFFDRAQTHDTPTPCRPPETL